MNWKFFLIIQISVVVIFEQFYDHMLLDIIFKQSNGSFINKVFYLIL